MSSPKPVVLLDVHMEGLREILSDKGWNVETVTKKLGVSKEDRNDKKIIEHAQKTGCVVVTEDGKLIPRLRALGIELVTIEIEEKAEIVHKKLQKKYG